MSEQEVPVKFEPTGRTVHARKGDPFLRVAARAGIVLDSPCGGNGKCGKCRVRLVAGAADPTETEKRLLDAGEIDQGLRLACQARVAEASTVEVPETSIQTALHQILGANDAGEKLDVSDAPVRKVRVDMPRPSREDPVSDLERIERVLGKIEVEPRFLRELPRRLRDANWRVTATLAGNHLIDIAPADADTPCLGAAFDVGTTTIASVLIDLETGEQHAAVSRMNPQTRFGDDVLSRILYASQHEHGLEELHAAVLGEINDMLRHMASDAATDVANVCEVTFSGNTTMLHLLTGTDPHALGQVPFAPAFRNALALTAEAIDLAIHPRGRVYVFPSIGGFVGGDTVAGILATDLAHAAGPTVLVDIGTNGEIVIAHEGRLLASSTAAGPAFEGARISNGMRAAAGAIEHVAFDGGLSLDVIGGGPPVGLCGSALIDLVAEMRRTGILDEQGAIVPAEKTPPALPEEIRARIEQNNNGPAFCLASSNDSGTGDPIRFTQRDVREFQLATAAIRAGVSILLAHVNLQPAGVGRVLIAGGFGNYLDRGHAQCVGLLPEEVPTDRILYVGNASLAGARLALTSQAQRNHAETIAKETQHIDLSLDPDFQMAFAMAMQFPPL